MNKLYIVIIVLASTFLGTLIVFHVNSSISIEEMLLLLAAMNGLAIIGFCIGKLMTPFFTKKQEHSENPKLEEPLLIQQEKVEPVVDSIPSIAQQWSIAMYKKYTSRWNDVIESIKYPIEDKSKAEISLLCWEIASQTMDYLLVDNDDQNVLERNRSSVEAVLSNKNISDRDLKEYFDDPSTIPTKVIGVHDFLSSQLAKDQSYSTQIFGYLVKLSPKDE